MRETSPTFRSQTVWERIRARWCAAMHDTPMWPINGQYECRRCGRHHAVPWARKQRPLRYPLGHAGTAQAGPAVRAEALRPGRAAG